MIEFRQVSAERGGREILREISLTIPLQTRLAILGRSGSGKSTLLRLLNRLLEPSSGAIEFNGQPIAKWPLLSLRRAMGFVPQSLGLFPHRTARQQIERFHHHESSVDQLGESIGLTRDMLDRYPSQLSGGQQQRVAIARALASDPPVLLLDEPFSALDPILRAELQQLILGLNKTILFVTHDLREALRIGHQILFLRDGKPVFHGDTAALSSSTDSEILQYLAS